MSISSRATRGCMRTSTFVLASVLALGCGGAATTSTSSAKTGSNAVSNTIETRAKGFITELAEKRWDHPATAFDETMSTAATPQALEQVWHQLEAANGSYKRMGPADTVKDANYRAVLVACEFEHGKLTLRIVFDRDDKVTGFFVAPPNEAKETWTPPPYADQASFEEREVRVGTSPALPGTLTLPKGAGPYPAVVLVHGSGPSDRDETVLQLKPFKDLAWGLASRGVAVLRYVKRSKVSPAGIVTQRDEAEVPAAEAIRVLQSTPQIDPKRVFLVGHSQGGYLAPRIAAANPTLAGVVILAGSTRPVEDSIVEQTTYFMKIAPETAALREQLAVARAFKERVQSPALRADENVKLPFGGSVTGAYFLDVRNYDPPAVAKELACPLLILQGDRDYQVTSNDFVRWKAALGSRPTVTFVTYPTLGHAFTTGGTTPSPADYDKPGNVDAKVVADIATFVLNPTRR